MADEAVHLSPRYSAMELDTGPSVHRKGKRKLHDDCENKSEIKLKKIHYDENLQDGNFQAAGVSSNELTLGNQTKHKKQEPSSQERKPQENNNKIRINMKLNYFKKYEIKLL